MDWRTNTFICIVAVGSTVVLVGCQGDPMSVDTEVSRLISGTSGRIGGGAGEARPAEPVFVQRTPWQTRERPGSRNPGAEALSYVVSLHESAINNLAEQWGGKQLDEATFWMILNEEFKFRSEDVDNLPPGRVSSVVQLADDLPVTLRLRDSGIDVTLRVRGAGPEGAVQPSEVVTLRVRYDLSPSATGISLNRRGEIAVEPATNQFDVALLERFFPALLTPRARFNNAGQGQRMVVRDLRLDNGWLVLGVGPAPAARVTPEAK